MGRPTWTIRTTNAFPCSVRLVFHFCKAFPCSVALIFFDEIAFPCRWRSIFIRSAPSGGSGLVCLDWSVWTGLSGPVCLDPVCLDPVCLDPVCLDPVCLDSVCLDPVCLDLSNLLSRALLPTPRLEATPSLLSASAGCIGIYIYRKNRYWAPRAFGQIPAFGAYQRLTSAKTAHRGPESGPRPPT